MVQLLYYILVQDGANGYRTASINNGLSYKVIFASFQYNTTGAYTFSATGCKIINEWGSNPYSSQRHNNAVFIPTSDNVTIRGTGGSMYVVGIN